MSFQSIENESSLHNFTVFKLQRQAAGHVTNQHAKQQNSIGSDLSGAQRIRARKRAMRQAPPVAGAKQQTRSFK